MAAATTQGLRRALRMEGYTGKTFVEIYRRKDGDFGFRIRSLGNGKILEGGEGYTRRSDAKRGTLRANPGVPVVERVGGVWARLG